jgi:hypothetical protein
MTIFYVPVCQSKDLPRQVGGSQEGNGSVTREINQDKGTITILVKSFMLHVLLFLL